jgi:hypothetical protein
MSILVAPEAGRRSKQKEKPSDRPLCGGGFAAHMLTRLIKNMGTNFRRVLKRQMVRLLFTGKSCFYYIHIQLAFFYSTQMAVCTIRM